MHGGSDFDNNFDAAERFLAYEINSAAGATIVVFAATIYFVTLILKPKFIK